MCSEPALRGKAACAGGHAAHRAAQPCSRGKRPCLLACLPSTEASLRPSTQKTEARAAGRAPRRRAPAASVSVLCGFSRRLLFSCAYYPCFRIIASKNPPAGDSLPPGAGSRQPAAPPPARGAHAGARPRVAASRFGTPHPRGMASRFATA